MHYIEVYDENYKVEARYSYLPKEISKVFSKIKNLNTENKKFKHYFIE